MLRTCCYIICAVCSIMFVEDDMVYILSLLVTSALLFLGVYFMITLSDLESDYINSLECCTKLNFWTIPRLTVQSALTLLLLVTQHWLLSLISLPFTSWLCYQYLKVPPGNSGVFEPTEVHIRPNLRRSIKESLVYMAYHMISFFSFMWLLVWQLTGNEESPVAAKEMPW